MAVLGAALAVTAYVAWPCATRAGAVRREVAARAHLAAHLAAQCEALGSRVAVPAFTCWVATEAARLPLVPRACTGRAHQVLRLETAFGRAPRPAPRASPETLAPLDAVLATLAGAYPEDAVLRELHAAVLAGAPALRTALAAYGFRVLELAEDGEPVRSLQLVDAREPAPTPRATEPRGGGA
jgi:hypothetical protein